MRVRISSEALAAIRSHSAEEPGREVCGLLLGTDTVEVAQPAVNVAPNPRRHFEIDPVSLFAAIRAEREGGPRLLGYYHSHPGGRAEPSDTDRASAAEDGKIWVIVGGDEVRAWRAGEGGLDAIELSQI